jgi:hypothetical protein
MSQENVEVMGRWYDLFQLEDWEGVIGDADPELPSPGSRPVRHELFEA